MVGRRVPGHVGCRSQLGLQVSVLSYVVTVLLRYACSACTTYVMTELCMQYASNHGSNMIGWEKGQVSIMIHF